MSLPVLAYGTGSVKEVVIMNTLTLYTISVDLSRK